MYGYPRLSTRWDMYDYYKIEPKKHGKPEIPAPLALHIVCADQFE